MKTSLNILLVISIIIFVRCDIFEVRDSENPTDTKSGYRVPVVPQDVIQNIINSFRDRNANDYKKNFAEGPPLVSRDFFFLPSGNVQSSFPSEWSIDEEFQYFNNIVTRSPQDVPITLLILNDQYDIQADSVISSADYSISIPVFNAEPRLYKGNLKFTMIRDDKNTWVIYFWEDIAIPDATSWSKLKIDFYP
jgi:hypothetical protein